METMKDYKTFDELMSAHRGGLVGLLAEGGGLTSDEVDPKPDQRAGKSRPRPRSQQVTSGSIQLPLWAQDRRGMANDLLRSALLTVGRSEARRIYQDERIASLGQIDIRYSGEELRQKDADVLMQLLHYQRFKPLGDPINFRGHDLITELRMSPNKRTYQDVEASIDRLHKGTLRVSSRDKYEERVFSGHLIRTFNYTRDLKTNRTQEWMVRFEPDIAKLFTPMSYSSIDWDQRIGLSPLGKWLHSFYATHAAPFSYKVATLRQLCGSRVQELYKFRQLLNGALQELVTSGFLTSQHLDANDLVHVKRAPRRRSGSVGIDAPDPVLSARIDEIGIP
jgi:hypothetical protein